MRALPELPGCPRCGHKLDLQGLAWDVEIRCPMCRTPFLGEAFPAMLQGVRRGEAAQRVMDAGEASCYFHEENRAAQDCSGCGRFVCSLCALEVHGRVVCPDCFNRGPLAQAAPVLERSRFIWSRAGATALIVSVLVWPLSFFLALLALALALTGLWKPDSLTGHGRWRSWAVIVISLIVIGLWIFTMVTGHWFQRIFS